MIELNSTVLALHFICGLFLAGVINVSFKLLEAQHTIIHLVVSHENVSERTHLAL